METKDGKMAIYAKDRGEWRTWLQENSDREKSVWLILFHKKSQTPSVNLIEATEEALCFGWIDSLCKKRDHESYYLTFSMRNPKKSKWSLPNIQRAERMIELNLMTAGGQRMIDIAREKGLWNNA